MTISKREDIAADWDELAKKGLLPPALYLFSCRLAWQRYDDVHAHNALRLACQVSSPELRSLAARLLATYLPADNERPQWLS